jgi:hypothetical protein
MTRRRKKTKLGIWFGVATLLVLVGGFAVFVVWPRPPGNVSSIESWLNSNDMRPSARFATTFRQEPCCESKGSDNLLRLRPTWSG